LTFRKNDKTILHLTTITNIPTLFYLFMLPANKRPACREIVSSATSAIKS
jgi:hypothetical protein